MSYVQKDCSHVIFHSVSTLFELCTNFVSNNVTEIHKSLKNLSEEQNQIVFTLLPLKIPLDISIPLITEEVYWKRKCLEKGQSYVDYWLSNCSWRKAFVFSYVEFLLDSCISGKISFAKIEKDLAICQQLCQKLKINGYKWNLFDKVESPIKDRQVFEDQFEKIFTLLGHLEEFDINIIPRNYEDCNESTNAIAGIFLSILVKNLHKLEKLQKFTISGTYMGTSEIKHLMSNICLKELQELRLSCCFISDVSCESIATLLSSSKLQNLTLCNNNIGNIGIRKFSMSLHENNSLTELILSKNCIENEGAVNLAECLKTNNCLKKLDLSYNKFDQDSVHAFCSLIQNNKVLCCLNLSGNFIGEEAGNEVTQAMKGNKNILIFGVQFCGFKKSDEDTISLTVLKNNEKQYNEIIED
ncbi:dynein regulatory complex subunit 5-like [Uloborus diversus]|uniref:dynein regulatory complex subunit 5-like n=1 Tax=Uloborus diversus TaxID=327109 RepID=UPI002409203C|nr:dynein regulatory complex subunit 5-like [Uloborus diversus]